MRQPGASISEGEELEAGGKLKLGLSRGFLPDGEFLIGIGSEVLTGILKVLGGVTGGLSEPRDALDVRIGTCKLGDAFFGCSIWSTTSPMSRSSSSIRVQFGEHTELDAPGGRVVEPLLFGEMSVELSFRWWVRNPGPGGKFFWTQQLTPGEKCNST